MSAEPATARIESPIGMIELAVHNGALVSARIDPEPGPERQDPGHALLDEAVAQVRAYFDHRRDRFDLPLIPLPTRRGNELRSGIAAIGFGETLSYGELANRIGSSARAVGQACRRNPYPLIIPCHRVVSSGGAHEYYSGGAGPETKAWLLDFEAGRTRLL